MNDVVARLAATIRGDHGCDVRHVEGVEVKEMLGDAVVWHGVVEVFDLVGHPSASRCYAWAYQRESKERRVVVLHAGPIDSPRRAVQAALVHQQRSGTL